MDEYGSIYCITNSITGLKYIGQTTKDVSTRLKRHIYESLHSPNYYFHRSIHKYGSENFIVEEIAKAYSLEELNALEKKYIEEYNTLVPNGYNVREGGEQKDIEFRAKGIQDFYDKLKENPEEYEEYLIKKGVYDLSLYVTKEGREKSRLFKIGKKHPHTEETKKQISETLKNKGHKPSEDCFMKAREARLGSHHSVESRNKISENRKGIEAHNKYIPSEKELEMIKELRSKKLGLRKIAIEVFGSENSKCKLTRIIKDYNL